MLDDAIDTLGNLAIRAAQAQGARVSVRLNAWPGELHVATAEDLSAPSSHGVLRGQVVIRDYAGRVMATMGPDIKTNWLLFAGIAGGAAALVLIIGRGLAPRKRRA